MSKIILLPKHELPRLHKDAFKMSFANYQDIYKSYKEIIGLMNIDHFSINVVDNKGEMSIISFNPSIAFNIIRSRLYLYNGSISPTFYKNKKIYSWCEGYDYRFKAKLKIEMELKHNISSGVVISNKISDMYFLFSFATKNKHIHLQKQIENDYQKFLEAGKYCFNKIKNTFFQYIEDINKIDF